MSGSGISWVICKSAPHSRQTTTPAPHYSVFSQAGCRSCRPTNSVKALKISKEKVKKRISGKAYNINTHTHVQRPFVQAYPESRDQKGKANLDFTGRRDSEWQWHQLGHMQVCTSLQTDNHGSTLPLKFFTGWMPFLLPKDSIKALKAHTHTRLTALFLGLPR